MIFSLPLPPVKDLLMKRYWRMCSGIFLKTMLLLLQKAGEGNTLRAAAVLKELMIQYLVKRKYAIDGFTTEELCARLYEDMAGYSFLKKWIYRPGVEEVNINAYNDIEVIMNSGRSIKIPDKFSLPSTPLM